MAVDVAAGFMLAFSRLPLPDQGKVLRFVQELVADPNACSRRLVPLASNDRLLCYEVDSQWCLVLTEAPDRRGCVLVDLVRSDESDNACDVDAPGVRHERSTVGASSAWSLAGVRTPRAAGENTVVRAAAMRGTAKP